MRHGYFAAISYLDAQLPHRMAAMAVERVLAAKKMRGLFP